MSRVPPHITVNGMRIDNFHGYAIIQRLHVVLVSTIRFAVILPERLDKKMRSLAKVKITRLPKNHGTLLVFLLLMILSSPILHQRAGYNWLVDIFLVLLLLVAVRTVATHKRHMIIGLTLGLPALVSQISVIYPEISWLTPLRDLCSALFLFWASGLILRDILIRIHTVTIDLILGAVNVYLMVAVGFAFLYGLIEFLQPGSFTGLEELISIPDRVLYFFYFSFATITTLGYGDISPLTPFSMTASFMEAIFGQLYLAILVARLVAMYIGHRKSPMEEKGPE